MGDERTPFRVLIGESFGSRLVGKQRSQWMENIILSIIQYVCDLVFEETKGFRTGERKMFVGA